LGTFGPLTPNWGKIMTRTIVVTMFLLLLIAITPSDAGEKPRTENLIGGTPLSKTIAGAAYGKLPLSFEPNRAQTDGRVKFLSGGQGYAVLLMPTEAVLSLRKGGNGPLPTDFSPSSRFRLPAVQKTENRRVETATFSVVRVKLIGANPKSSIEGIDSLPG